MAWTKLGNRHYDVVAGVLKKASYDEDEDVYNECGSWQADEFSGLGQSDMDENSWTEKSNIEDEFNL